MMGFGEAEQGHPLSREVRLLLQAAMVVFTWTVVIGILNGSDVANFGRKAVLSHVHMGTLGWITMCVFAAALWLFGASASAREVRAARVLSVATVTTLPGLAITFALTFGDGRAVMGLLALLTIVAFFGWVLWRARAVELTTPHLGFLAAMGTSVAGGTIGVLLATRIATGRDVITSRADGAHPGTMVIGFLVPVGMALAEWALWWPSPARVSRAGLAQMGLPFLGGLVLMVALLLGADAVTPIAALLELAGVAVFVARIQKKVRSLKWRERSAGLFGALAGVGIILNILFINYLAARYSGDFDAVPKRQLLALDHTMFVGVLTNAVFALLMAMTKDAPRWRFADRIVLVGMNAGLVVFVASLIGDWIWVERVAAPIMGASVLLGLVTYSVRFATRPETEAVPAEGATATVGP